MVSIHKNILFVDEPLSNAFPLRTRSNAGPHHAPGGMMDEISTLLPIEKYIIPLSSPLTRQNKSDNYFLP